MQLKSISDLQGLKVTVMGLGLNGGGLAATEFLTKAGALVTATDLRTPEELKPTLDKLAYLNDGKHSLNFVLGEHRDSDFEKADIVIKNPAIRKGNPFLAKAKWIETDLSLFLRFTTNPIVAVTGSKGKSTTVSALYHLFQENLPHSFLGGNITKSPLSFIDEALAHPEAPVVLELSSWQLADIDLVQREAGLALLKPKAAVITNIMHDHQNAYDQFDDYVKDKELIFKNQDANDTFICLNNNYGRRFAKANQAKTFFVQAEPATKCLEGVDAFIQADNYECFFCDPNQNGQAIKLIPSEVSLLGLHSRLNLLYAALCAYQFGIPADKIVKSVAQFKGIAYRMQSIATHALKTDKGSCTLTWVNDSAATMPDAMLASVCSFKIPTYLITGGTDKALEFEPYTQLPKTVKGVYPLAGTATEKLLPYLPAPFTNTPAFHSLKSAVDSALEQIKKDGPEQAILLLSPGAASFGMFKNEFDRGDQFAALAKNR